MEKAILINLAISKKEAAEAENSIAELAGLATSAGATVVAKIIQSRNTISPKYYIGEGKVAELEALIKQTGANLVIIDSNLTPAQQRNLEETLKVKVLDRTQVILDIFAERAITKEAILQVELARMQYSLPRLTRAWTHLSRQRGGAKGTRGEGEKQIEADRRMVQQRITNLKLELEQVRKQRATMRKSRQRSGLVKAAIVGYTNVGKSTLLNALADADVLAEDKLFATLDPSTRKVRLGGTTLLMTDTVGFVRKLPHTLVEAFKSTLEEAAYADFLVAVLDVSSQFLEEHWETTIGVLNELEAADKEMVVVFNKCDLPHDEILETRARGLFPDGLFVSVKTGQGMAELVQELTALAKRHSRVLKACLPPARHDLAAMAHRSGEVLEQEYDDNGNLTMIFTVPETLEEQYRPYLVK